MNIEVYCDEAYPDLFSSRNPQARFLIIGGVWLKSECRDRFKCEIHALRNRHRIGGEIKWTKVSPSRLEFYKDLLKWFFDQGEDLRFRCIAIDWQQVDLCNFHQNDQELGFYKFYYQMLHHWIHPFNSYRIYCDYKSNRLGDRLHTLKKCIKNAHIDASIENVQAIRSRDSLLIQLADLMVGVASSRLNKKLQEGGTKEQAVRFFESLMGHKITPTALCEKKFNVFKINLGGGW